jgi:CBS domain-containing protein
MAVLATRVAAAAAVRKPDVHGCETTVGEVRRLFLDDHIHMALLVDGARLVATVERRDLHPGLTDDLPAQAVGTLRGRTVPPDEPAAVLLGRMRRARRRRLAVTDEDGILVGLLCLTASGRGFCTDEGIASRRLGRAS